MSVDSEQFSMMAGTQDVRKQNIRIWENENPRPRAMARMLKKLKISIHFEREKRILDVEEAASIRNAKSVLSSDNVYGSLAFLKTHFSDLPKYIEYLESSSLQLKYATGVIDLFLQKQIPGYCVKTPTVKRAAYGRFAERKEQPSLMGIVHSDAGLEALSKSTDMSLSHLSTLKCHRPDPGSNPQPWAQKASAIPTRQLGRLEEEVIVAHNGKQFNFIQKRFRRLATGHVCRALAHQNTKPQEDRDITYALFCSVLCIMEQVLFDEILILSVEENQHVYDKRRASYKDEKMKENMWLSIAASLNTDRLASRHECGPCCMWSLVAGGSAMYSALSPGLMAARRTAVKLAWKGKGIMQAVGEFGGGQQGNL
ncbi:hypothetical protein ANN_02352 [Periplaneta americana]|uniref:MADF domain-containing protein n=1 Tax=Periplaneta americana TaxID=6978 RepID=A0ABQ8TYI7_PERAM|nr:hypothetical protein ANN_02352 [Periplaneta americana]